MNTNAQVDGPVEDARKNGHVMADDMTSKDYYFDSYAHFGIHEVGTHWCTVFYFSSVCVHAHKL